MTPDPDDQFDKKMEAFVAKMGEYGPNIEAALRKVGLYVVDLAVAPHPHQMHIADPMPPVIVATVTIGDVAWSDRVQNPLEARMDVELKQMEQGLDKSNFEDLRDKLQKAVEEGKDPLEGERDEPDSN